MRPDRTRSCAMEVMMTKFYATTAVLLLSGTSAYAAAPEVVTNGLSSCCSALAACCEALLACCG